MGYYYMTSQLGKSLFKTLVDEGIVARMLQ